MPRIHTLNPAAIKRRGSAAAAEAAAAAAAAAKAGGGGDGPTAATAVIEGGSSSKNALDNSIPLFRYNGWWKVWWDGEYSLILTKAAFLHRDFLKAYTDEMPSKIR